jgi:hypothetical protein
VQTFETVRSKENEEGFEENLNMPADVKERVQITTLIFAMMALGTKYSSDLYTRVLNIIKELKIEKVIRT